MWALSEICDKIQVGKTLVFFYLSIKQEAQEKTEVTV